MAILPFDLILPGLLTALAAAMAGAAVLAVSLRRERMRQQAALTREAAGTVLLFDRDRLVDATPRGRRLLSIAPERPNDRARILAQLVPRFGPGPAGWSGGAPGEFLSLDGSQTLRLSDVEGRHRFEIARGGEQFDQGPEIDAPMLAQLCDELEDLRMLGSALPLPVWRHDAEGRITWANTAYMALAGDSPPWPPRDVFGTGARKVPAEGLSLRREIPGHRASGGGPDRETPTDPRAERPPPGKDAWAKPGAGAEGAPSQDHADKAASTAASEAGSTAAGSAQPSREGAARPEADAAETGAKATPHVFDCHLVPLPGGGTLGLAQDAGALRRAESTLHEFVQALATTFATLDTGIAVFDDTRRLSMFNPALTDLTGLPGGALTARPDLADFMESLRERRMIPEPKDHAAWRDSIQALESGARAGLFAETWHLPFGRAMRVTGRPQLGDGFALLFEDVTATISLTRRFRAQVVTGQAVIDVMDEALVVFDQGGVMTLSNAAYDRLWAAESRDGLDDVTLDRAVARWQSLSTGAETWQRVTRFVHQQGERVAFSAKASLRDGRVLDCHAAPIAGGSTLLRFRQAERSDPSLAFRSNRMGAPTASGLAAAALKPGRRSRGGASAAE